MNSRILVFTTSSLLLTASALGWQQEIPRADAIETRASELAGPNAINCGRVPIRQDAEAATDCAIAAQKARKPFRVIYEVLGVDARSNIAIVRDPHGLVYTLRNGGIMGLATGPTRLVPCPVPVRLWVDPQGHANCSRRQTGLR